MIVRRAFGVAAVAALAYVSAYVLGEYELTLWTSLVAGAVVGALLSEVLGVAGGWAGVVPAVVAAAAAAATILWAGRIDSNFGIDPFPTEGWLGAAVAAAVAAGRLVLRAVRPPAPDSSTD